MVEDGIPLEHKGEIKESHIPVLAEEVESWLDCRPGRHVVDCTVGYGGLAKRILSLTAPDGLLLGIDRDGEAIARTEQELKEFGHRVHLIQGNFRDLTQHLSSVGITRVDGMVFDLGLSSPQLDRPERGFSFLADGPLDMRMDRSTGPTAEDLVTRLPEQELADMMYRYGEERFSRRIARAIVGARERCRLHSTRDLAAVVREAVPAPYRHGRLHCATRTFQALRIAVNQELDVLEGAFRDGAQALIPGGRLCVISFHSLEDRIAKQTFKAMSQGPEPLLRTLTKKPIAPSAGERERNPRARSAKLRVAERL